MFKFHLIIYFLFILSASAEDIPVFKNHPENCKMDFTSFSKLIISCTGKIKTSKEYDLSPSANFKQEIELIEMDIDFLSKDKKIDLQTFREFILKKYEDELKFKVPSESELIVKGLDDFNKAVTIIDQEETDCSESKPEAVPFIEVKLDQSSTAQLKDMLVEEKMKGDGFLKLGKFKSFTLNLNTLNDNALHGGGRLFIKNQKAGLPWWEGDDRGFTFGEDLELKFDYENGSILAKQYSKGYSKLTNVTEEVELCDYLGNCNKHTFIQYYDDEGKRYQNFLSVDGLMIEVRKDMVNNDYYIKVGASTERLTDSASGISQAIQTEWHKMKGGTLQIQYNNLPFKRDESRQNAHIAAGIEKAQHFSWLTIKEALEGKVQASTAEKENSYVELTASVSVDSGTLFNRKSGEAPLLEAKLSGSTQRYGTSDDYSQMGLRFAANLISDKSGNIISIYTSAEKFDNPFTKEFSSYEEEWRGRTDIIWGYGVSWTKPIK